MRTWLIIGVAAVALSACGPTGLKSKAADIRSWAVNGLNDDQAERALAEWDRQSAGAVPGQRPPQPTAKAEDENAASSSSTGSTTSEPPKPPPTQYIYIVPSQ